MTIKITRRGMFEFLGGALATAATFSLAGCAPTDPSIEKSRKEANAQTNLEILKPRIEKQMKWISVLARKQFGDRVISKESLDKILLFKEKVDAGKEDISDDEKKKFIEIFEAVDDLLKYFVEVQDNMKILGYSITQRDQKILALMNDFTETDLQKQTVQQSVSASSAGSSASAGGTKVYSSGPNPYFWYWYYNTFLSTHPAPAYAYNSRRYNYTSGTSSAFTNVPASRPAVVSGSPVKSSGSVPSVGGRSGGFSGHGSSAS